MDASYGGATHDSFIWSNHPLKAHLESLSNMENIWFLGKLLVLNHHHQPLEVHYWTRSWNAMIGFAIITSLGRQIDDRRLIFYAVSS